VGGISTIRCIVEILDALYRIGAPATLALAGPWERPDLAQRLHAHPAWPLVQEHGFLGRVAVFELLRTAQAGLVLFQPLKNHLEAQPNKLFEYMLAGLPIIASDFPLWRSIVDAEGCGLLVDPMSPDAIAGAMKWISDHPDAALEMGLRGRQAVLTRYNWTGEFGKLLGLYGQLS
jgi:glycosyltransferase involved in cell wall biosynthesis